MIVNQLVSFKLKAVSESEFSFVSELALFKPYMVDLFMVTSWSIPYPSSHRKEMSKVEDLEITLWKIYVLKNDSDN